MQILVTGGCGFIGSHVVDRLVAEGHNVTVLDNLSSGKRDNLNQTAFLIEGDVADGALVAKMVERVEAVIHLAAVASVTECTENWLASHRTNLTGTVAVLNGARANKTPVIYASSAAVYGDNTNQPLAETAQTLPLSAYGLDKLSCEKNAEMAWKFYQVPSVGLRFFNVYGPRQDASSPYSGVISKFMANAKDKKPLTFFGDGEQTRDFIYVADIVELIMKALKQCKTAQVFNGCTGRATSLKQLAAAVSDAVGTKPATEHKPAREGDIRHSLGDPKAAQGTLKFTASTSLADGLKQLATHA